MYIGTVQFCVIEIIFYFNGFFYLDETGIDINAINANLLFDSKTEKMNTIIGDNVVNFVLKNVPNSNNELLFDGKYIFMLNMTVIYNK